MPSRAAIAARETSHDRRSLPVRGPALPDRRTVRRHGALPLLDVPQAPRRAVCDLGGGAVERLSLGRRHLDARELQVVGEGAPRLLPRLRLGRADCSTKRSASSSRRPATSRATRASGRPSTCSWASKAAWYTITDALPQYDEYPPEFGMPSTPREPVAVTAGRHAGQLPLRRRGLRDLDGAAAHVLLSLLALPPGPQRRALRQRLLQGRGLPLDARRGPGAGLHAARGAVSSARRSASAAARPSRACPSSATSPWCRRARSTASPGSLRPGTSSSTRRRRGSTSATRAAVRGDAAAPLSSAACSGA